MIAEKELVASCNATKRQWWGVLPPSLLNLITMKPMDFRTICSLGNLWYAVAHNFFPDNMTAETVLNQDGKDTCHRALETAKDQLTYVGLEQAAKYIPNIRQKIGDGECDTYGQYLDQVDVLDVLASNEIEGIVFGFLPRDHGKYFNQDALFGSEVNDKFRQAADDIKEAGNCYAHGTYTACVFHLTRVLEVGLKSLAATLKIEFVDINAENWGTIIDRIESEIRKLNALPRGSAKSESLDFYSGAAKQFRYFKDHWRNPVDHFRGRYDGPQALSALTHVKEFMQDIAPKIKE